MDLLHRERSQGRAAMHGREVACLPGGMGSPLGLVRGRASPFRAKSVCSASVTSSLVAAYSVSGAPTAWVIQAITFRTRFVHSTDEVPRRSPAFGPGTTARYKSHTKGSRHAPVTGTGSPRPRLWGCQQRQSRGAWTRLAGFACSEKQNLRVPRGPLRFMGPVSPARIATTWLGGTSSRLRAGSLSNSPQQPEPAPVAVRSR